ncbi:MAG: hypothetical protein ACI9VT_000791 [Psychroserpens sp.]|jgi:hypothetical protein
MKNKISPLGFYNNDFIGDLIGHYLCIQELRPTAMLLLNVRISILNWRALLVKEPA